ncbi:hypothetical protein [Curtobacterium sp. MCBD17_040]|uniref:hypothetical protein n=1 Tax=Curtobacterium sp. MCBD17_040 TaxID=2175674 RepID=UPI000DA78BB9|nr:hypothetical protein [Curtobacterium sp. MCBD17_040]WIB64383.1 hypothetical protein DEI94_04080 [Curtobacterium sp. MCBD17_040]
MKKIIPAVLATLVALTLTGCGKHEIDAGEQLHNCEVFALLHNQGQTFKEAQTECIYVVIHHPHSFQTPEG